MGHPAESQRCQFEERFDRAFTALLPSYPIREVAGAAGFVALLRRVGWRVAFATGGLRDASRTKLRTVGIPFTEPLLVTASEYPSREEIVSAAVRAAAPEGPGAVPVSVGDGLWDLLTAEALGLCFLGVGTGTKAQLLADRRVTVLRDLSDPKHCLGVMSTLAKLGPQVALTQMS